MFKPFVRTVRIKLIKAQKGLIEQSLLDNIRMIERLSCGTFAHTLTNSKILKDSFGYFLTTELYREIPSKYSWESPTELREPVIIFGIDPDDCIVQLNELIKNGDFIHAEA